MKKQQTFQQAMDEVIKELNNLGAKDPQKYFYELKQKEPHRFERITFDMNWHSPISKDLEEILFFLIVSGLYETPIKYSN